MGGWSVRLHAACAGLAWCVAVNLLWIAGTLAGGVLFGLGPATVTASILTRRRMRGEAVRLRDFWLTWRRELVRGTAVVLPVALGTALLATNYMYFAGLGPRAGAARLVTFGALILAIAVGAYVAPMYAHYDLPTGRYLVQASRFALARPASTLLLLVVATGLAFASATLPVLLLVFSIGAWLHTSTWLCVRFFEENEHKLAEAAAGPPTVTRILPAEPLRIR